MFGWWHMRNWNILIGWSHEITPFSSLLRFQPREPDKFPPPVPPLEFNRHLACTNLSFSETACSLWPFKVVPLDRSCLRWATVLRCMTGPEAIKHSLFIRESCPVWVGALAGAPAHLLAQTHGCFCPDLDFFFFAAELKHRFSLLSRFLITHAMAAPSVSF